MALEVKLYPEKPFLFDYLLEYLDRGVFHTTSSVCPNIPLVLKVKNIVSGETLSFYLNDKKVYEVVCYEEEFNYEFMPEWDKELNTLYVIGSVSGKSDVIAFIPQNFAVFLWLFSEMFVKIIQELAQVKQDLVIYDDRIGFKSGKDLYDLSKYVLSDFIPPLKGFIEREYLQDAYFSQVAFNRETTMDIFLVLFYFLFRPYLIEQLGGVFIFPVMYFWYDELVFFTLESPVDRISRVDGKIYFNQNFRARLSHRYYKGIIPEESGLYEGTVMIAAEYWSNIWRNNGTQIFVESFGYPNIFPLVSVIESYPVKKDREGRWFKVKDLNYVWLFPNANQLNYLISFDLSQIGLKEDYLDNWVVVGLPFAHLQENQPRMFVRNYYSRYIPLFIYYYEQTFEVLYEPSFFSATSDVRLFPHRSWSDGEIYILLKEYLLRADMEYNYLGKQVLKAIKKYWELSKLVDRKFYLMVGLLNTSLDEDKVFYQDKAKPVLWHRFRYIDYLVE